MFGWEFKRCKANDNYIRQKTDTSKEQSEPHDRRSMMVRRGSTLLIRFQTSMETQTQRGVWSGDIQAVLWLVTLP